MKSLRPSLSKPVAAKGMSKLLALLLLLPLAFIEFIGFCFMVKYGFRAMGEIFFVLFLWNLGICFALTFFILTHRKLGVKEDHWREVSNYLNLNKIGKDKF